LQKGVPREDALGKYSNPLNYVCGENNLERKIEEGYL
jgi:hypothetical protein